MAKPNSCLRRLVFDLMPDTTVEELKRLLEHKLGIPSAKQLLSAEVDGSFFGAAGNYFIDLEDDALSMKDYGIDRFGYIIHFRVNRFDSNGDFDFDNVNFLEGCQIDSQWKNTPETKINRYGLPKVGINITETAWAFGSPTGAYSQVSPVASRFGGCNSPMIGAVLLCLCVSILAERLPVEPELEEASAVPEAKVPDSKLTPQGLLETGADSHKTSRHRQSTRLVESHRDGFHVKSQAKGYLRDHMSQEALEFLRVKTPEIGLWCARPRCEPLICQKIRSLVGPLRAAVQQLLTLDEREILGYWRCNAQEAAGLGVHMHFLFELCLNRGIVPTHSMEFRLLIKFLSEFPSLRAFRSEWAIFAEPEMLAGTIDFVAVDERGWLVLVDWKRTKDLKHSAATLFKRCFHCLKSWMTASAIITACSSTFTSAFSRSTTGIMLVACCHPDTWPDGFVDAVPSMGLHVQKLMLAQRRKNRFLASATNSRRFPGWSQLRMVSARICG
eukprot:symbB.v1.2.038036.t3/scaffold5784.1/size26452/2